MRKDLLTSSVQSNILLSMMWTQVYSHL